MPRAVVATCRVPQERLDDDVHVLLPLLRPLEAPDEAVAACALDTGGMGNADNARDAAWRSAGW